MGKTTFKLNEEMKAQIVNLYNLGMTDKEIAHNIGNVTDGAIYYWRKKLGLKTKFDYSQISKIKKDSFEPLFKQGLSDAKIAEALNVSVDGVYSYRKRNNYDRDNYTIAKFRELTTFQKEVLLGTMLGDSSFKKGKGCINPAIQCAHGIKQKEYCEYKTQIFSNLGAYCKYHKRNTPDKRNGKYYEDYTMYIPANPMLEEWYNLFYPNGKKVIPLELLDTFTEISLAFMFMDDGSKTGEHAYEIATNCFSASDITAFRQMLKNKFNLDTTMLGQNVTYIKTNSQRLFEHLISPYLCDCMRYKLH